MSNFYQDVIKKNRLFTATDAVGDVMLLDPVTRAKAEAIIADAAAHGVTYMIFETYRSTQRQEELFKEGSSKLKTVGVHHYGLACDIVRSVNGNPSWKGDFSLLGQLAHGHGLIWGGDWGAPAAKHTFIDPYHVQRCALRDQAALFREEFYPSDVYDPYNR